MRTDGTLKDAAFSWYPKGGNLGGAMRTDRWRYVEWVNPQREIVARELYDELNDPQENENVFDRPETAPSAPPSKPSSAPAAVHPRSSGKRFPRLWSRRVVIHNWARRSPVPRPD